MKVISLSSVRKAREKDAAKVQADANAARFGRTKGQKAAEEAGREKAKVHLDGHERQP